MPFGVILPVGQPSTGIPVRETDRGSLKEDHQFWLYRVSFFCRLLPSTPLCVFFVSVIWRLMVVLVVTFLTIRHPWNRTQWRESKKKNNKKKHIFFSLSFKQLPVGVFVSVCFAISFLFCLILFPLLFLHALASCNNLWVWEFGDNDYSLFLFF